MKHRTMLFAVFSAAILAGTLAAQNRAILAAEKGKLRVMLSGAKVADEDFSIAARGSNWLASGDVEINMPDGTEAKLRGRLTLNPQGLPQTYEWSLEGAGTKRSGTVSFEGGTASFEVRVDNAAPFTGQFYFDSPRVIILDNNFYHHYAVLARLYDWRQKGPQTFRVFIPQDGTPGEVTVEAVGEQSGDNGKLEQLRVRTPDLEIELYLSKSGMARIAVPAANVVVERQ